MPHDSRRIYRRGFYISNQGQIQAYVFVRPRGHWSIHQEAFVIYVTALTFIEDKVDVRIREKSQLRLAGLISILPLRDVRG